MYDAVCKINEGGVLMARYRLRVPKPGTFLYGDGDEGVVAETVEEARDELETPFVHSVIGVCRVVYARDVEAEDCHDEAEPGDTTVDYCDDDGRELGEGQIRVWFTGPPQWHWRLEPIGYEPVNPAAIPLDTEIGDPAFDPVKEADLYWVRIVDVPTSDGDTWSIPVKARNGRPKILRVAKGELLSISPAFNNWRPNAIYRLTVKGERAEGTKDEMDRLLTDALASLDDEWRRKILSELETVPA